MLPLGALEATDVVRALAVVALGLVAGVLSGMLGVGGAVVTTPGIRALGATPIHAVGSTVPAILPGALSGTWRYHRAGLVDWRVGLTCGLTGTVFAVAGAVVADVVDARLLMVATAALMLWSGISVERSGRAAARRATVVVELERGEGAEVGPPADAVGLSDDPPADDAAPVGGPRPAAATLAGVGALSGAVAGLLGVGGGIIMLPMFTSVLGLPVKRAVAASLVAVAIFSVPALVTHAAYGHVDWSYALPLVVGVVPGAQLGSRLTIGVSESLVRRAFGVLLVVTAVAYGASELAGR